MFESRYSKVLTVILVIVIIAIIGLLGFLGYDFYQKYYITKEASEFVDNYKGDSATEDGNSNTTSNSDNSASSDIVNEIETASNNGSSSSSGKKQQYNGFDVVGTINIPSVNIKYMILDEMTRRSLETAVVVLYPNGDNLNQPGNTVIVGHNYRNGLFFSNLKRVNIGDKVIITDYRGTTKTYSIYDKQTKDQSDTTFYQRDTGGKTEITLSTCTDASNNLRTVVFAREE